MARIAWCSPAWDRRTAKETPWPTCLRKKSWFPAISRVNWKWGNNVADPDADYDNWIRVLDDLAQWDIRTVVVGHGSLGSTDTLRAQRAYLADMQAQVRAGIKAGKSADQLVKEIDLSRHGSFGANAGKQWCFDPRHVPQTIARRLAGYSQIRSVRKGHTEPTSGRTGQSPEYVSESPHPPAPALYPAGRSRGPARMAGRPWRRDNWAAGNSESETPARGPRWSHRRP